MVVLLLQLDLCIRLQIQSFQDKVLQILNIHWYVCLIHIKIQHGSTTQFKIEKMNPLPEKKIPKPDQTRELSQMFMLIIRNM